MTAKVRVASAPIQRRLGMARRRKGTVGVVGLGIMGGAFARNLAAAGWRVDRPRHRSQGVPRGSARRRRDRQGHARPRRRGAGHHHQPAASERAARHGRGDRRREGQAARGGRGQHVHARRQAQRRARAAQGRPHHARLPDQRHRLAGQGEGHRRLCQRRSARDPQAQAGVRRHSRAACTTSAPSATPAG